MLFKKKFYNHLIFQSPIHLKSRYSWGNRNKSCLRKFFISHKFFKEHAKTKDPKFDYPLETTASQSNEKVQYLLNVFLGVKRALI